MKKIYIKENKFNLLTEINEPDSVEYNGTVLHYQDNDAYPFIVLKSEDGINVEVYKHSSTTHMYLKRDMAAKMIGFGSYEEYFRYVRENPEEREDWDNELDMYINEIHKNTLYEGRYWCNYEIISFWDKTPSRNVLGSIFGQLSKKIGVSIKNPKIGIGYEIINFRKDYNFDKDIDNKTYNPNEEEMRNIHLMNQDEKRKALSDFRNIRGEKQGKKLGDMSMAKYHNLIYQEGKEVFDWKSYHNNLKLLDENIKNK